jgi:FkbM family methyltransferase
MNISFESQLQTLQRTDPKNVYILGRNQYALSAARYLDFKGFIDDESAIKSFANKEIFKFSILDSNSFVVNASTMRPLAASLKISQYTSNQIHIFSYLANCTGVSPGDVYWNDFKIDYNNYALEYEKFENSLSDAVSVEIWTHIKEIRLKGEFSDLDNFPKRYGLQYFPEFLNLEDNGEVFYDIGSFDGGTSLDFLSICKGSNRVYAFEPNPQNSELLAVKLGIKENVEILEVGLSNVNRRQGFSENLGSASHFDAKADLKIELVRLDSLHLEPPTFIKMDIEGMERLALEGSASIIEKHRPKLAISIYHLFDDVRVIFGLVTKMLPDSRIYIRHYSEGIHETVLFCIPN